MFYQFFRAIFFLLPKLTFLQKKCRNTSSKVIQIYQFLIILILNLPKKSDYGLFLWRIIVAIFTLGITIR
jgi:hypothetical protein